MRPSLSPHTSRLTPLFVLVGAQLAIGSAALMARSGLQAGLSAPALAAWRLTAASLLLLAVLNLRRAARAVPLDQPIRLRLAVAGVMLGLHFSAWFASLQYISVARSTLLVTTSPVFAGLAGVLFLRHRLPRTFWIGLAVAVIGVWLVTAGNSSTDPMTGESGSALYGDGLAVLGAVFIAVYLLLVQDTQAWLGTWRTVAWTYSSAALAMWPVAFLGASAAAAWPRSSSAWLSIGGMALFPQLLGHTALNWSLKRYPAGAVAAATLLEPVFAAALAWWLLAEPLTARQALGAAVLLGGVGLSLRKTALPVEETL